MSPQRYRQLILNAALILLLALLTGFGYGQIVIADIQGLPPSIPGDLRGWRMAHLECLLNGILLLAIAAAIRPLRFGAKTNACIFWGLLVCGWTNAIASSLSPLTGGRGAVYTGFDWNSLNHVLFMAGVLAIIIAIVALIIGCASSQADDA
jgi:hypothetical protein